MNFRSNAIVTICTLLQSKSNLNDRGQFCHPDISSVLMIKVLSLMTISMKDELVRTPKDLINDKCPLGPLPAVLKEGVVRKKFLRHMHICP